MPPMNMKPASPNAAVTMTRCDRRTGSTQEYTVVFDALAQDVLDALDRSNWCTADFDRRDGYRQVLYGSSVVQVYATDEEPTKLARISVAP